MRIQGNDHQLQTLDCETTSPYQQATKCMKNSLEDMYTDVRVVKGREGSNIRTFPQVFAQLQTQGVQDFV